MKKLLVLLQCYFILAWGSASAQHTEITAVYNGFRDVITYDARNNKISDVEQEQIGNIWKDIGSNKTIYDEHNNVLSAVSQYGWQNFFTYDARNNRTSMLRQYKQDSGYVNYDQYFYTYDSANKKTGEVLQKWDGEQWVNNSQSFFGHERFLQQNWNGKEWINASQRIYTYDARGNKICELYQNWKDDKWVNIERWSYTYNDQNTQLTYVDEIWDGTSWGPWQPMRDGIPH
jgi:hypothetical protein